MGSKCTSTFSSKRSGNISSRSRSGGKLLSSSWSVPPSWPSAADGSGGGDRGPASVLEEEIPALALTPRACGAPGRRARALEWGAVAPSKSFRVERARTTYE